MYIIFTFTKLLPFFFVFLLVMKNLEDAALILNTIWTVSIHSMSDFVNILTLVTLPIFFINMQTLIMLWPFLDKRLHYQIYIRLRPWSPRNNIILSMQMLLKGSFKCFVPSYPTLQQSLLKFIAQFTITSPSTWLWWNIIFKR